MNKIDWIENYSNQFDDEPVLTIDAPMEFDTKAKNEYVVAYHCIGDLSHYYKYFDSMDEALEEAMKMHKDKNYSIASITTHYYGVGA